MESQKDPIAVELGKRGGEKRLQQIGKEGMKELSNKALQARLAKGQIKNIRG